MRGDDQSAAVTCPEHALQASRFHDVVLEEKLHPFSARIVRTTVGVASTRSGSGGALYESRAPIARRELLYDGDGVIRRSIVDEDDLEVFVGLSGDAGQRFSEERRAVVRGYADTDLHAQ